MPKKQKAVPSLGTNRIQSLTDSIFAISMTIQVLSLNVPEVVAAISSIGLNQLLLRQFVEFFNYARSFLLLAVFWIVHHQQFHYIQRTDQKHLWINIITLMFVALIPFTTALDANFNDEWIAEFLFGANLLVLGLLMLLNWEYATRGHRLVKRDLPRQQIVIGLRRGSITPLVALIAMIISIFNPGLASYTYLAIPFLLSLPIFRRAG